MKFKRFCASMLAVVMGAALLSGCGSSSTGGSSSGSKDEIVFWNPFTGPDNANIKAMIAAYNKTNPEFKVKNVSMKEGDMYVKIPTVVNSGKNIPDLNIVHAERIKQYKDSDLLETFTASLSDFSEINADNYVTAAWNIGDIDGERYSVPLDIHNWGTYYNKELLEKYAPNALDDNILTFDEIKEAGEKAKKDDIRGIGITWAKPNFLSLMKQEGGELTADGIQPTLDTDASKEALTLWKDMVEEGVTSKDGEDPAQLFLSGKLLFYPEGIWMHNNVKQVKFDWGLTNSPQLSDDPTKIVNWASSHQFVMLKNDERSDEKTKGVLAFIDWIRENSLEWAKAGQNPATLSILDDEEYKDMAQSFFIATPEQQETLNIFDYKYNGYVSEYLDAHALDAVFGKAPVDKVVSDMQKEVRDKVAKDNSN